MRIVGNGEECELEGMRKGWELEDIEKNGRRGIKMKMNLRILCYDNDSNNGK